MQLPATLPVQEYFKIRNFIDVPIPQYQRRRTDIFCTIISSIFVIMLFAMACYSFNPSLVSRWAYPTDSTGKVCGRDLPQQPYMYFVSAFDTSKRLCLSDCPQMGDNGVHSYPIGCHPNVVGDSKIQIYNSYPQQTVMGKFCFPTNPRLKEVLLSKSGILSKYRVLQAYKTILYCLLLTLVLGIIYMLLVQFIPEIMISVSIVAGGITMIVLGIILLTYRNQELSTISLFRYVFAIGVIFFGVALLAMLYYCGRQLKITGIFLRLAGRFIRDRPIIYLVIAVFFLLILILLALFAFQVLSFFSYGNMIFYPGSPYYQFKSSNSSAILHFLCIVQLFWGLNFLREASVFIISGLAVEWYTHKTVNPLKNLIFYHWGSVVACSFMVGFLGIPDMIYLLLTPQPGKMGLDACGRFCAAITSPFESISMYIRQQSMTYINLTGIPYCNASVYSEYLNWQSYITRGRGSRPIMRYYRYGAYCFLLSIVQVFGVLYQNSSAGMPPLLSMLIIWMLGLYLISGFVDSHADAASALMITLMLEEQLEGSIDYLKCVPPQFIMVLKSPSLN